MKGKIYSTVLEFAKYLLKDWLFVVSLTLMILSSLYLRRLPHFTEDEYKTLFTLFVFLLLLKVLEEERVFHYTVERFLSGRFALAKLVAAAGFLSLFITNDVALMVVVPVTLLVNSPYVAEAVILEAVAVNGLSSVSPIGNPQNIYIFYHYPLKVLPFVEAVLPLGVVVLLLSLFRALFLPSARVGELRESLKRGTLLWLFLFFLFLLSAVKLLPLWVGFFVLLPVALFKRSVFREVDYLLLGTFFCFFGFTDNLSYYLKVGELSGHRLFFLSSLLSQFMSNVPAALLLSDFTSDWKSLLWGVSVGGFGTLIASLANLIAYRLYVRGARRQESGFLVKFHLYGFGFFAVGALLYFICYS